jgi:hypothetical protein
VVIIDSPLGIATEHSHDIHMMDDQVINGIVNTRLTSLHLCFIPSNFIMLNFSILMKSGDVLQPSLEMNDEDKVACMIVSERAT